MRQKSQPVRLSAYYTRNGEGNQKSGETDGGVSVPEMVRNPLSSDGWRRPSPYHCEGISGSFMYGECSAEGWSREREDGKGYRSAFVGNFRGHTGYATTPIVLHKDCVWSLPGKIRVSDIGRAEYARAVNTAIRQLQNRQGHILETVAEFRSSIQGLTRNAQSITAFCEAFDRSLKSRSAAPMRKHFGLPKKHRALREWQRKLNGTLVAAKTFGSAWLTFWFGLAPVVSDMVLFMRILGDSNLFVQNLSGKGRGFKRETLNVTHSFLTSYNSGFDGGFRSRKSVTSETGVYVSLTCRPNKNWVMKRAREAAQLGSMDGLSTVWAVMPYSWLIDFVLPVSQYLKGWEGRQGLDFRGGTATYYRSYSNPKVEYEKIGTKSFIEPFGQPVLYGARTFIRTVLTTLPAPVFQPRLPADYWKATTALSLLAVKFNHYFGESPRRA